MSTGTGSSGGLVAHLRDALARLADNPCPYVAGPEDVKKRASVALIVRVQPAYAHWPDAVAQPAHDLASFFAQDWVKHGEPEVLFIKRAARKGDRWTSHVALPGGRRDPEDAHDQHAAVREAAEEVGIDLSGRSSIAVGNLPQRVVTTSWGKVPLMVLCPYVFLVTRHDTPPLRLQPTEVASTHWVPVSALLSPDNRTVSLEDVSSRLANQETGLRRWALRATLGKMEFAAVRLLPTESLYCHESPAEDVRPSEPSYPKTLLGLDTTSKAPQQQPLILWGLTLGVMADFLDLFPPHNALELWTYPTFTPPDVRLIIRLTTHSLRRANRRQVRDSRGPGPEGVSRPDEVGPDGLGCGVRSVESSMVTLIEGYYPLLRRGVAVAMVCRALGLSVFAAWLYLRYRRRLDAVMQRDERQRNHQRTFVIFDSMAASNVADAEYIVGYRCLRLPKSRKQFKKVSLSIPRVSQSEIMPPSPLNRPCSSSRPSLSHAKQPAVDPLVPSTSAPPSHSFPSPIFLTLLASDSPSDPEAPSWLPAALA